MVMVPVRYVDDQPHASSFSPRISSNGKGAMISIACFSTSSSSSASLSSSSSLRLSSRSSIVSSKTAQAGFRTKNAFLLANQVQIHWNCCWENFHCVRLGVGGGASVRGNTIRSSSSSSAAAASADGSSADKNELLKDAAKGGHVELVKRLVTLEEVKIDLPSEQRAGWTALHLASFYEQPEVVETLLKAGAQTETRNKSGNTALQLASLKGNINIARMLLESGADIHAESNDKGTALDYAAEWGSEEMVDFLSLWAAKAVPR
jgi:ankyrin repeat protein